jgi:hypothetical protein
MNSGTTSDSEEWLTNILETPVVLQDCCDGFVFFQLLGIIAPNLVETCLFEDDLYVSTYWPSIIECISNSSESLSLPNDTMDSSTVPNLNNVTQLCGKILPLLCHQQGHLIPKIQEGKEDEWESLFNQLVYSLRSIMEFKSYMSHSKEEMSTSSSNGTKAASRSRLRPRLVWMDDNFVPFAHATISLGSSKVHHGSKAFKELDMILLEIKVHSFHIS